MKYNEFGQVITTSNDLCNLLYINPTADLSKFLVEDVLTFNASVDITHYDTAKLTQLNKISKTVEEFDQQQQSTWHMPAEYLNLDISKWILSQCKSNNEIARTTTELLLYEERNLFMLLRYLKYMIDTFRKNNIIWGVGRGSSVASYVLYLLGVHKINSLTYDLDITEFLK